MSEPINAQQDYNLLSSCNSGEINSSSAADSNVLVKLPPASDWREGLKVFCESDEPPLVLVDMDNTLVNWELQFEKLMKQHHPQINIVPPPRRKEFKIELNYEDQYRGQILHLTSLNNFWLSMEPIEGAIEAINDMVAMGIVVFIVTTPDAKHTARSSFEKIAWVEKYLGAEWKYRTILTHDKTLVKGDILIDDKPAASVGLLKPSWTHALFAQPYNALHTKCPRLETWKDWGPTIYRILISREKHVNNYSCIILPKQEPTVADEIRHQCIRRNDDSVADSVSETASSASQKNSHHYTCCSVHGQIQSPTRHSINFSRLPFHP